MAFFPLLEGRDEIDHCMEPLVKVLLSDLYGEVAEKKGEAELLEADEARHAIGGCPAVGAIGRRNIRRF